NPPGSRSSVLRSVSCTSSTTCTAVASYTSSAGYNLTLAERWNGTSWALQTTPNPKFAGRSIFNGVSCASTTRCIAVGGYMNANGANLTLAQIWSGTSWSVQLTPNPSGKSISFAGDACSSTSLCTAVGSYTNAGISVTLAERYS